VNFCFPVFVFNTPWGYCTKAR